ncbi:MAG: DUF2284 domain-containing protein [Defluviitaleaceae bacterium]|nr:DUF2284 domain-containing protein [Defluviitaleaceae bacterium]
MKIGIGIDTGGTYTDAVVYNFETQTILGTAKSLTTKNDLSIGILNAIDGIPLDLAKQAELISLSTTLATNACVEDKGGRAKLIFFGGNAKIINEIGEKYGLPTSDDMYIKNCATMFSGEVENEPDWKLFAKEIEKGFDHMDGVGIIEMNAMRNGAVIEKKAKSIFKEKHNIPVVCSYELFSELNCLQRGASTLLNAGLFPVIREFLDAVKRALILRGINVPLAIVRSDGSLMSEEFAALRPVETLLCGPAASAIGGMRLSGNSNSIIVDMGGTTTDIALVKDGIPVSVVDGVSIGKWKTFVGGLYVKTLGLGGDSAIHYSGERLYLEDYRVTPLCVVAKEHPCVIDNLKNLQPRKHTRFLYEHYILIKDISDNPRYTDFEKTFCHALNEKPLLVSEAAAAVGKEIYTLDVKRLIKDGVVQICGLTPTDIMHIKGDFDRYQTEASMLGAEFVAFNLDISIQELCDLVYNEVKRKLHLNIVMAMLENKYPDYMKRGISSDIEGFINDNYKAAKQGARDPMLSSMFRTEYSLVGIGAPIHVFLDDIAKTLGTSSVITKHHEVANALGAVMGSVSASFTVEIKPNNNAESTTGYTVFGNDGAIIFEEMNDAMEYATSQAKEGAESEAVRRGAAGNLTVTLETNSHDAPSRDGFIYLGTAVTAHAVGSAGFSGSTPAVAHSKGIEKTKPTTKAPSTKQTQYNTEKLVQEALDLGFSQAGELNIKSLVFMPEVKAMCAVCPQYGKNWRCPPGCGSVEEAAAETVKYSYGLVVQTIGHMEDDFDHETIEGTSKKHNQNFALLVESLKKQYPDVLPMGAGTCSICKSCSYPDSPCRFPDKAISSMEAYGLLVSRVCTLSGIPYNNGKSTITFTSCYLLM